ncbi:MAG: hypothetical protein JWO73_203 [Candidatus Taylorbacteria bacterium]|nr:hypothetical protein [Candidatus Taylorbacteria bacterium]
MRKNNETTIRSSRSTAPKKDKKGRILDKFKNAKKADGTPMSRQQKHMLRKRAKSMCWICTEPALADCTLCLTHLVANRERARKKIGCKSRHLRSTSYTLENLRRQLRGIRGSQFSK